MYYVTKPSFIKNGSTYICSTVKYVKLLKKKKKAFHSSRWNKTVPNASLKLTNQKKVIC